MNRKVVFDAYAILALIENDTGAQTVADMLADKEIAIFLSVINFGEIYYIILRRNGEQAAEEVIQSILLEESLTIVEMPWPRVKEAARIKSRGGLSYADAFALSLAKELYAPLVTGDPEIRSLAQHIGVEIIWL
ncbi:MAG: type II toxin-antitoxin system VapC family toxin [Bacillota bacterium]|nr:type II toxin-antitoxin system VapC family toxin [Bacillota bacterium]